jgi:N6-L-threonylcarbamoyladenine synthase
MILGIESTAHTIGIGVFNGKIRANVYDTYPFTKAGFLPRELADHHAQHFPSLLKKALDSIGGIERVSAIAVSQGPGIGAPLSFGVSMAKFLAVKYGKPLIPVHHGFAHLYIGEFLWKPADLFLYISGGNTQLVLKEGCRFRVIGETLDIGVGNLFDNVARFINAEPANGAGLERLAETGKYIQMPYSVKGMNLSFTGILTHVKRLKARREDIAYSVLETAFAMLIEVLERAVYAYNVKRVIVCGGVAKNRRFKNMVEESGKEQGYEVFVIPPEFARDNGAMIAVAGSKLKPKRPEKVFPKPKFRIEEVRVCT